MYAKIRAREKELACEVIGETNKGYKCRMLEGGWLPRKNAVADQIVYLPKYAVRIEGRDKTYGHVIDDAR